MSNRRNFKSFAVCLLGASSFALSLACAPAAYAQDTDESDQAQTEDPDAAESEQIVVTGTLLRGIAPTGTNVVGVTEEEIQATGATSTNDVLAKVPQISNSFNKVVVSSLSDQGTTIARPNIRNLGASGTNSTLVLVDGHRIVGAGVLQTTPDPDVVPPGMLARIEIVPDGGSSIYGSDAIGGVINLITKRRFDGVEASGRYGFADDYYQFDTNLTVGKDWGTGSLFASGVFTKHDAIFGRDRDYIRQITPSTACAPGTITINPNTPAAASYRADTLAAGTNTCDPSDNTSIVPDERRYSIFAGLNQDLNESITIDLRAFYTNRLTNPYDNQFTGAVTIPRTSPFFRPIGAETSQSVAFSYSPVFGPSNKVTTQLHEWGVTPSVTADLGGGWQLRALGNYGRSFTSNQALILNTTAQDAAAASTLNPYNPTATSPAVLAGLRNLERYGEAKQDLGNGRVVLDGSLFSLPGGDVRVAVGGELTWESYGIASTGSRTIGNNAALYRNKASRTVNALFGEIAIPIFGDGNNFGGMDSLTVSASGRYDHYSDFGSTFNPKFGITWNPVNWFSVRGNYGTSFNAPSLADTGAAQVTASTAPLAILGGTLLGVSLINPTTPPLSTLQNAVFIVGGNPDLKPQEAETYSFGVDIEPPFIPGLTLNATYYNVNFTNQISIAFGPSFFAPGFDQFVITNPTQAQVAARLGSAPISGVKFTGLGFGAVTNLATLFSGPLPVYLMYDARRNNLGSVKTDGIDFNASYNHDTSFGSINANVAGSYVLGRKTRVVVGAAEVDNAAADLSRFNLSASLGARVGNFNASATLYHNSGYKLTAPAGTQLNVGSYDTVDLFFAYNVNGSGLTKDLAFTVSVNNVFDNDPPFYNNGNGYANGSTLGRLVQFGISKKF